MKRISGTRILASLALWMAAVASVAAIAWLAIDTAGRQVTSSRVAAALPTRISTVPGAQPTGVPSDVPTTSARPSPTGKLSTTQRPSASHSAKSTPNHGRPPSQSNGRWGSNQAIGGQVYVTAGGRVRVSCRGRAITLAGGYAQPSPGWSVHVLSAGPAQVEVMFELPGRAGLLVVAGCPEGHPQFDQDRIEPTASANPGG